MLSAKDVCGMLFDSRCMYNNCDPFRQGKILTASCLLRGENLSCFEAEKALFEKLNKHKENFVEWIPDNIMNSFCQVPATGLASNISGTILCNSSATAVGFQTLSAQFEAMFRKNAYVHWYTAEGMDVTEFREAHSNVLDLIAEYQQYENATINEEDDGGEMEDMVDDLEGDQIKSGNFNSSLKSTSTKASSLNGSL